MSVDAELSLGEALASIKDQEIAAEIIIVNSGRQIEKTETDGYVDYATVVQSAETLFPGGARNLGIKHSSAPIVCFLAADCVATNGWLRNRLDAHLSGFATVSSALRPAPHENGQITHASWASYWTTHPRRRPESDPVDCLRYGLSYKRSVFAQIGLFREDLRIGEDTQFNERASAIYGAPCWSPEIVTLHRYPATLARALQEQFRRAKRSAEYTQMEGVSVRRSLLWHLARQWRALARLKRMLRDDPNFAVHRRARSLLPLLSAARALGAWSSAVVASPSQRQ